MLHARCLLVLGLVSLMPSVATAGGLYDVTSYGAVAGDAGDDADAFRKAVSAAATSGGGTVYVPAGLYRFSSTDSLDSSAHVVISSPGVRIAGDTPGDATSTSGSAIYSEDCAAAIFKLRFHFGSAASRGTVIENLHLGRGCSTPGPTAAGILFDFTQWANTGPNDYPVRRPELRNLVIRDQRSGVMAAPRPDANRAVFVESLVMSNCQLIANKDYGCYLEEFTDLKISDCEFRDNGLSGLRLYPATSRSGRAAIQGSVFRGNGTTGMDLVGNRSIETGNWLKDVQVTGCNFTNNISFGFQAFAARNVAVSGCVVSSNSITQGVGRAGVYFGTCSNLSISGTNFEENAGPGATLALCTGVAMSGCVFSGNCSNAAGAYALNILAGARHSYSALSFRNGGSDGPQDWGILIQQNPRGLYMNAITFDSGMTSLIGQWLNSADAEFVVEYFDGNVQQRLVDID